MLRILLMGELRVDVDGKRLALPTSQNARALLAILARSDGPLPRAVIARNLWPTGLDSSVRDSLNTELHKLRKALGTSFDDYLIRSPRLQLGLSGDVTTDLREVEQAIVDGDLDRAVEGSAGTFISDVEGDWVDLERRRVHSHLARQFHRVAARALADRPDNRAIDAARRALEFEPDNDGIVATLVKLLAGSDRADEAQAETQRRIAAYIESGRKAPPELYELLESVSTPAPVVTADELSGLSKGLLKAFDDRDQQRMTSILNLDEVIGEMPRGLVAIAARPSMGMTSLLTTFCINTAEQDPSRSVLFFTPDTDEATVTQRLIANHASIRVDDLRGGRPQDARKWQRILASATWLEKAPIFLLDRFDITAAEIATLVDDHAKRHEVSLVLIDDFWTVAGHLSPAAAAEAMLQLRGVSRALEVPIVVAVPVADRAEHRTDKRPLLSDLPTWVREARPDLTIGLYRDEFYDYMTDQPGELDLIVMENRRGNLGVAHTTFQPAMARVLGLQTADGELKTSVARF